jgi:Fe-S cluster assembly protein SufD
MPSSASQPSSSAPAGFTADAFAAHLAAAAALPPWWLDLKKAAWNQFNALPMPARTDELWRSASVQNLALVGFVPAPAVRAAPAADFHIAHTAGLAFENNRLIATAALPRDLVARGVVFEPLERAVLTHADLFRRHFLAQPVKLGSEKFTSLHTAFASAGALLYVPKGVEIAAPVVIVHHVSGTGAAIFPHTLVVADENSRVTVVEFFLSTDPTGAHLSSGVNDLHAGPGAQLTYVAAQNWGSASLAFQSNSTVVQRDARVLSLNVHLGGRQARHESHSRLQGPGAHSEMLALTVAHHTQEFDQRTLQSHQAPHTSSNLLYKNALLDTARTIFSGLIIVDPDAQKTDAYQSNRNLLLSADAEANSLPGLEIQANDVRCTHGATSGHVDDEQMFYLESRGIRPEIARELLVFGFFEEVLGKLENNELHDALREMIKTKFQLERESKLKLIAPRYSPVATMTKERTLSRDVAAVQIPSGDKITLAAGSRVIISQVLGGSYTVLTDTGLARIDGQNADALGETAVVAKPAATAGAGAAPSPDEIWEQLRTVYDPEIPVNIVDLGLVYSMDITKGADGGHQVDVAMTLTAPGCGMGPVIAEDARSRILLVPGVSAADVRIVWEPPWNQSMISEEGKMKLGLI